jgi:uncharacterized protein (DUF1684 family)
MMSDFLELYDFRLQVKSLYTERNQAMLAQEQPEMVNERFRRGKDTLFATHPQSALDEEQRAQFHGLHYFPYNPALCILAEIDTRVEMVQQEVVMNAQESMNMTTIGKVSFTVGGVEASLALYWLDIYGGGLFLPFRDRTCPQESYGGGRYLFDTIKGNDVLFLNVDGTSIESPASSGARIMLDFNYAYNPSCAYNDRWTCPLAPVENRLAVPIAAGEKKYKA